MDGGDGRTPGRGLVCLDSPPVSELKRFRLHVCRDGGRQSLRECDVEKRGISRPVVNETWMG